LKKVIIAEKPSVAKNIADAYKIKTRRDGFYEGDDYLVTWAFGHLLQLYDAKDYDENMKGWRMDKFPFIPEGFKYKIKCDSSNREVVDKGAEKQINIIKGLIDRDDVDGVISATDFDREGQVISDELFIHYDIKKPIYRLLLNEWTEDEVKKGMANLKPNSEMKPLQDAGIGRQLADWTIGINLTSVATLRYGASEKKTINIGRVLLPTLKIIYDRDKEIENFKESSYYKLLINLKSKDNIEFESLYYENASEKFEKKEYLDNLSKLLKEKQAVVVDKEIEKKREYPQSLFNLSNLQGYITSKYKGWTSDKVLKVAQGLYEKKLITYPRTASSVLEESLVDKAKKVLETHKKGLPYEDQIKFVQSKRVFDNSKVESHSAITPTYVIPKGLTTDEQHVYNAIKNRFIMQFMPVAQFEETKITLKVNDEQLKGEFISKGKVEIVKGWRVVEKIESKDTILPLVEKGENLDIVDSKVNKVTKKPPKYHTEKTLLRVMETCGKSFKDDKDDVYAELILALWEAVTKLKYVENDGQCLRFLEKALQNKFYELYRSSRKKHDNQFASEMEMIDITVYEENKFIDIIIEEDLKQILKKYKGMKYKIYKDILGGELSDYKIAKKYNITRQYVHRLRKQLYLELRERYFDIKK